ncbi:MAG: sigma factor-like helix-turn-helix DNA-binding protein [Trueperaceae bacterium]|nr:sigma factor-like helix-turn-helix DNA-binding protein [Trueperaceae bacterium]
MLRALADLLGWTDATNPDPAHTPRSQVPTPHAHVQDNPTADPTPSLQPSPAPRTPTHAPEAAGTAAQVAPDEADRYHERGLPDAWRPVLARLQAAPPTAATPPSLDPSRIDHLFALLESTWPRDAAILRRRADGETLDAVGTRHGITRERVRQLQNRARKRLRSLNATRTSDAPRTDDDLLARLDTVDTHPLLVPAHGPIADAIRRATFALHPKTLHVQERNDLLLVTTPDTHALLARIDDHVHAGSAFTTLDAVANALDLHVDLVATLAAFSERTYPTHDGALASHGWTVLDRMKAVARVLAEPPLEAHAWHGSEMTEALKVVFPDAFAHWRARNALATLSSRDQKAFVHTGKRGTWRLADEHPTSPDAR